MGSRLHSLLQARLARLLGNLDKFEIFTELSLEIDRTEYKPDICVYQQFENDYSEDDVKMTELPLLAIEILSPSQGFQELVSKVKTYFAAGIKSAWIVLPSNKSITVFSSLKTFKVFSEGNLTDTVIGLDLPLNEIFK